MPYLTKAQTAKLLHVTVRTITTYMSKGLLPEPRRLGRRLLWDEEVLQRFVAASPPPSESRQVRAPPLPPELQPIPLRKPEHRRKFVSIAG